MLHWVDSWTLAPYDKIKSSFTYLLQPYLNYINTMAQSSSHPHYLKGFFCFFLPLSLPILPPFYHFCCPFYILQISLRSISEHCPSIQTLLKCEPTFLITMYNLYYLYYHVYPVFTIPCTHCITYNTCISCTPCITIPCFYHSLYTWIPLYAITRHYSKMYFSKVYFPQGSFSNCIFPKGTFLKYISQSILF